MAIFVGLFLIVNLFQLSQSNKNIKAASNSPESPKNPNRGDLGFSCIAGAKSLIRGCSSKANPTSCENAHVATAEFIDYTSGPFYKCFPRENEKFRSENYRLCKWVGNDQGSCSLGGGDFNKLDVDSLIRFARSFCDNQNTENDCKAANKTTGVCGWFPAHIADENYCRSKQISDPNNETDWRIWCLDQPICDYTGPSRNVINPIKNDINESRKASCSLQPQCGKNINIEDTYGSYYCIDSGRGGCVFNQAEGQKFLNDLRDSYDKGTKISTEMTKYSCEQIIEPN